MPFCAFPEDYVMLGATPVDNLFILNFVPVAPGDYVRVYLYALMQCHYPSGGELTKERVASMLDLKEDVVNAAFTYWERQGLARRVSDKPPAYLFLHPAATLMSESPMEKEIYKHRDFNNRLQKLFGSRLLQPAEFTLACEWVDDLKLPEDVIFILVEHYISTHPPKFQFSGLNRMAVRWAEEGILSEQAARDALEAETEGYKAAQRVLKQLGIRRKPSLDELSLTRKWLDEWRLSTEAVLAACKETVKSRNPSFGYLDAILARYQAAKTGEAMERALEAARGADDSVKRIHASLGLRAVAPTPEEKDAFARRVAEGFEPEAIYRVADELGKSGSYDMQALERALSSFAERGQLTLEAASGYFAQREGLRETAVKVLEACGISRKPTAAEMTQVAAWLDEAPKELMLYAAAQSALAQSPLRYMARLMTEWKNAGITNVEEAAKRAPSRPLAQGGKRAQPGRDYAQREYTKAELDEIYVRFDEHGNVIED